MTGSGGQRRVPENFLAKLRIPLPPMTVQRRIAEVLDRAEALRAKRRSALAQLDSLTQSIFVDLFGDSSSNPRDWLRRPIGELVEPVRTWNPSRSSTDETFNYIDLGAIDQDSKIIKEAHLVSCGEAPSRARQLVACGDVLVSTVRPNLNGVARVPAKYDGATASTGFCVLRSHEQSLDGNYLFQWVKSPGFIGEMVNKATGASYPAVSDRIIFNSLIVVPPLPLQLEFAGRVAAVDALKTAQRMSLAELDALFATLEQRAFQGEL